MDIATFSVILNCTVSTFEDPGEIPRILRQIAYRFEHGDIPDNLPIFNLNGNKVGKVITTPIVPITYREEKYGLRKPR
jgi:hypothetical protein